MIPSLYIFRILPSNTGGVRKKVMIIGYLAAESKIAWSSEDQSGTTVTAQTVLVVFLISPQDLIFPPRAAS